MKEKTYSSDAVARALRMSERRLRTLRNVGLPEYEIPMTAGGGTNQGAFSTADVVRIFAVAYTRTATNPEIRKRVFDAISREQANAACRTQMYLIDTFGRSFVTADVAPAMRSLAGASVTVLDLTATAREALELLARNGLPRIAEN